MNHHALVHETKTKLLSQLGDDRLRGRKAFPVERVTVHAIVENEHIIDIGFLDWSRVFWLYDESSE